MALIFGASTDVLSGAHTSRIIGPFLRWLDPAISEAAIRNVQLVVRKCGHLTEYAVLAWLSYRAVRRSWSPPRGWSTTCAAWALGIAVVYAATDEWHQSFVPSRDATVHDVIIDGAGAALGLVLRYRWHLWRQARELQQSS
jgi:VanZ family protein